MRNPIKTAIRKVKRDVPGSVKGTVGGVALGIGGGIAVVGLLTGGAVLAPAVVPAALLYAAMGGGFGAVMGVIAGNETLSTFEKVEGGSLHLNGFKLIGDDKDLTIISRTQQMIDKNAKKIRHIEDVPEGWMKDYIRDAEDALKRLTGVYEQEHSFYSTVGARVAPESFFFTRERFVEGGALKSEKIYPIPAQMLIEPGTPLPGNIRQVGGTGDMKSIGHGFDDAAKGIQKDSSTQPAPKGQSPKP